MIAEGSGLWGEVASCEWRVVSFGKKIPKEHTATQNTLLLGSTKFATKLATKFFSTELRTIH